MKEKRFPKAFSIVMLAYMRSTSPRDGVNREIRVLLDGKDKMDLSHCQHLEDIVKDNRLHMYLTPNPDACLTMKC